MDEVKNTRDYEFQEILEEFNNYLAEEYIRIGRLEGEWRYAMV